jgi:hypothetical protein
MLGESVEGRRLKSGVSIGQLPTKLLAFLGLANPLHFNAARSAVGSITASSSGNRTRQVRSPEQPAGEEESRICCFSFELLSYKASIDFAYSAEPTS